MSEMQAIDSFKLDHRQLERALTLFDKECATDFKLFGLRNGLSRSVYWVAKEIMDVTLFFVLIFEAVLLIAGLGVGVGIYQWAVHGKSPSMMDIFVITTLCLTLGALLWGGLWYAVAPITTEPMVTLVSNAPPAFTHHLRCKTKEGNPLTSHDVHVLADAFANELRLQEEAARDRVALDLQLVALDHCAQSELKQGGEEDEAGIRDKFGKKLDEV